MKIRGLLFILVLLGLTTCKNEVNILAKYKEVPVVYALLSTSDTVHYIRIQKGYQANGNAYLAGGVLDSIYYPDDLKVTLTQLPSGPTYTYQRVVINYNPANPLSKDSGTFAYGTNILYADSHALNPNGTYSLLIIDTSGHDTITAQTTMVQPFQINSPYFIPGQPLFGTQLELSNTTPAVIDWEPATNGAIYDVSMQFNYLETNTSTNTVTQGSVTIPLTTSYIPSSLSGTTLTTNFVANSLFSTLVSQLSVSENVYRDFDKTKGMTFTFSAGGNALANYLSASQAQSGITSDEALPPYTNIPGGLGIFSSRLVEVVDSVQLAPEAIDSLACNSLTVPLRFRTHNGQFCY